MCLARDFLGLVDADSNRNPARRGRDAFRRRFRTPARVVRRMLVQLGIERPILFGHSFGATVALALALDFPGAVRSVVLASGYYFPTARLDLPFMAPAAVPVLGDLLAHTISPLMARA